MSMKRILGMMLASRMAGRGMRGGMGRGGFGAGLGGLAGAGMLGGGLGRKAGLAALGYMAYRAYQDHQVRTAGGTGQAPGGTGASTGSHGGPAANAGGGLGGGLGGIMKSVSDALTGSNDGGATRARAGAPGASPEAAFTQDDERAAESFSEDTALLLVRGMVAAANADGTISPQERAHVMAQADEAGADAEDRRVLERELANPRPLDQLLGQVRDQETAEEFYLASRMAVDGTTEANRTYLARLRERLGLPEGEAAEIDRLAT